MSLLVFYKSIPKEARAAFAARCGTTDGHLRNIAYECKTCAPELAISIERESHGTVRAEQLRPDVDWAVIRGSGRAA